jgi:tetratricopeptide (TPR) repeat protein
VIQAWRWETDAHPGFHADGPQGLIDKLMNLRESDLVVGIFWTRFGTPTTKAPSGTVHELQLAIESWRATQKPQVMVYFNGRPYRAKTQAELDQWGGVLKFRGEFPPEGLWWEYPGARQFEPLFRQHLTKWLLTESTPGAPKVDITAFEPPVFDRRIVRPEARQLLTLSNAHGVVAVEGLGGIGKTSLLAAFADQYNRGPVYWHDPERDETVDELLLRLGRQLQISGSTVNERCKALLSELRANSAVLIIDDFHVVDQASYSALVAIAERYSRPPASLIVASRTYVDLMRQLSNIGRLSLPGFDAEQTKDVLTQLNVPSLGSPLVSQLVERTDGLPFAVGLFAKLVVDFGRDPADLLSGSMLQSERLREWFDDVMRVLRPEASRLLRHLSVVGTPFSMEIVRALSRAAGVDKGDGVFEELQRSSLVTRYSRYRFHVHQLVATFSLNEMTEDDQRRVHSALGRHYLSGSRSPRVIGDEALSWKIRACREFQLAAGLGSAKRILDEIQAAVKSRGYYKAFIQLAAKQLTEPEHSDAWLRYHYAHCCFITGRWKDSLATVEPLLYSEDVPINQRVPVVRLYAELLAAMGHVEPALAKLDEVLSVASANQVKATVISHALSVRATLLIRSRRLDLARLAVDELLRIAAQRKDLRGGGVALTLEAMLTRALGDLRASKEKAGAALQLFRDAGDVRGMTWSMSQLAIAQLGLGDVLNGEKQLTDAVRSGSEMEECSLDYLEALKLSKPLVVTPALIASVEAEIARINGALNIMQGG